MDRNAFLREVLGEKVKSIYIMEGQESYLKQLALNFALEKLISEDFRDLNITYFENPEIKDMADAAQTLPIMSDYRAIVVRGCGLFDSSGKSSASEADNFISFANDMSGSTLLFILVDKLDSRKKCSKTFKNNIVNFNPFSEAEAQKWIIAAANKAEKNLSYENAQKIVFKCGNDAATLKNELDKLIAYNMISDEITSESIEKICSSSISYSAFNMTDALLAGNIKQAISILKKLLQDGENEYMLFAMLLREMRISYYIKVLHHEGNNTRDISEICGVMAFAVEKRLKLLRKYRLFDIKKAYKYCIDSENEIKEGRISQIGIAEKTLTTIFYILNKN